LTPGASIIDAVFGRHAVPDLGRGFMSERDVSRRNFMIRTIIGIGTFIGAALTIPLGGFGILPVLKKKEAGWSDAGTSADLNTDEP